MRVEVSIAVNFVLSFLYNRLPRRRVNLVGERLLAALTAKFQGHWYPDQPMKGTAFRCLKISGDESDPLIIDAARETGLDAAEVTQHLPQNLTLWVDPGEVSCRVGEKGAVTQLYSAENSVQKQAIQEQMSPICDTQWTYLLQSSAATAGVCDFGANCFTAADFAQTKFGSTKLRQPPRTAAPRQQQRHHRQQQQLAAGGHIAGYGSPMWNWGNNLSVAIPSPAASTGGYGSDGSSGHSSPLMMSKYN